MNNYISLNGKYYKALAKDWTAISEIPATVRTTLNGKTDAAFAAIDTKEWMGTLMADNTPASGYGTKSDLESAVAARTPVTFIDHYGNSYQVIIFGQIRPKSISPKWDAAQNSFNIPVRLVRYVA